MADFQHNITWVLFRKTLFAAVALSIVSFGGTFASSASAQSNQTVPAEGGSVDCDCLPTKKEFLMMTYDRETVTKIQMCLVEKGFYNGKIDGVKGPTTIVALEKYQAAQTVQAKEGMQTIWNQRQLMENLNSGAVREISIVPGGIKGKYYDSYGRLEVFMVPERAPGEYSSLSPEISALIQKHGVQVIPQEEHVRPDFIIYGALFLQITAWLIILSVIILLVKINAKLNRILDALNKRA